MFSVGLAEIVLIVRDLAAAARFYHEVVGLQPVKEAEADWAWFYAGEPGRFQRIALHTGTLLFEEHSPYPAGERFGRIHFALEVPPERLDAAAEHVREQGVEVYGPVIHDSARRSYYFYDPDGHLLEFITGHI